MKNPPDSDDKCDSNDEHLSVVPDAKVSDYIADIIHTFAEEWEWTDEQKQLLIRWLNENDPKLSDELLEKLGALSRILDSEAL